MFVLVGSLLMWAVRYYLFAHLLNTLTGTRLKRVVLYIVNTFTPSAVTIFFRKINAKLEQTLKISNADTLKWILLKFSMFDAVLLQMWTDSASSIFCVHKSERESVFESRFVMAYVASFVIVAFNKQLLTYLPFCVEWLMELAADMQFRYFALFLPSLIVAQQRCNVIIKCNAYFIDVMKLIGARA